MSFGGNVVEPGDFYIEQSVLHPIVVGIPLMVAVWVYLRLSPNRLLTNLAKFDWIVSVTLGSTLSRVITGTATQLDMTRGALSLLVIIVFQIGLAYSTTLFPSLRPVLRSSPQVVVFRGQLMKRRMDRDAVTVEDVRVGMRRNNVLTLDEIEVMFLEASGGFTCITRKQLADGGFTDGRLPECLQGLKNFQVLFDEALQEKRGRSTSETTLDNSGRGQRTHGHRPARFDPEDIEAARQARETS